MFLLLLLLPIEIGKLRRQENEGIANCGTRAVVRYKANKGPKGGRTRFPTNEATYISKFFRKLFCGHPLHLVSVPEQNGYLLVHLLFLLFLFFPSFFFLSFFSFSFFPFFSFFPLFLPSLFSFCQHKKISGTNGPMVPYIFHH